MRIPNPPKIFLDGLTPEQQQKVVRLALLVVADLAAGQDWSALDEIERAGLDMEEKLAFGSLLNSQQASAIVSLREAANAGR